MQAHFALKSRRKWRRPMSTRSPTRPNLAQLHAWPASASTAPVCCQTETPFSTRVRCAANGLLPDRRRRARLAGRILFNKGKLPRQAFASP